MIIQSTKIEESKNRLAKYKTIGAYLGRRLAPFNEKLITLLSKEKTLPAYKMRINDESPSFELEYEQIQ